MGFRVDFTTYTHSDGKPYVGFQFPRKPYLRGQGREELRQFLAHLHNGDIAKLKLCAYVQRWRPSQGSARRVTTYDEGLTIAPKDLLMEPMNPQTGTVIRNPKDYQRLFMTYGIKHLPIHGKGRASEHKCLATLARHYLLRVGDHFPLENYLYCSQREGGHPEATDVHVVFKHNFMKKKIPTRNVTVSFTLEHEIYL